MSRQELESILMLVGFVSSLLALAVIFGWLDWWVWQGWFVVGFSCTVAERILERRKP